VGAEPGDRELAVVEPDHVRAPRAEHVGEQPPHLRLIVDADDRPDGHGAPPPARPLAVHSGSDDRPDLSVGRVIAIVVPRPSSESTVIRPWWAATTRSAIASPTPEPVSFVVKPGTNSRPRCARGIPGPVSATTTSTIGAPPDGDATARTRTATSPPSGAHA